MTATASRLREIKEFADLVEEKGDRTFVSEGPIDFRRLGRPIDVFVVEFSPGPTVATQTGELTRRGLPSRAYHFRCGREACVKVAEFDDPENLESLELPPASSVFPVVMEDGRQVLVHGVVDKELAFSYHSDLGQ